jgi:hypothetical protein
LRSSDVTTSPFILVGASAVSSFLIRSRIPANIVVPSESTLSRHKSFLISSHINDALGGGIMDAVGLLPKIDVWKVTSGLQARSDSTVMLIPTGNSLSAIRKHTTATQVLSDIDVNSRCSGRWYHGRRWPAPNERWLEDHFWTPGAPGVDSDAVTCWGNTFRKAFHFTHFGPSSSNQTLLHQRAASQALSV